MPDDRAWKHVRWHSRGGFLTTTMLLLAVLGGPFLVTRGLLEHGALFLPASLLWLLLLGGPLLRLALATGQIEERLPGRESAHMLQLIVRLAFAGMLLLLAHRALGWMLSELWFGVPEGVLDFRDRELTRASTAWHGTLGPAFWVGIPTVGLLVVALRGMAHRRRLAGLSWISSWLLLLLGGLLALGVVVGYSLSGAGALAALAAPVRTGALLNPVFWGESAAIALIALGAQAGLVSSAGRGLPRRASIGRDSRILVAGMSILLVLGGLAGLLLLCALCVGQGIVPGPEHAAPEVLVLELVPALGQSLFPGWRPEFMPSDRQLTLAWLFLVAIGSCLGAVALLGSHRWVPLRWGSTAARFGYLAGVVALAGIVVSAVSGVESPLQPALLVLPALLAVMHITLARRAGSGMRLVSVAFASRRPGYERFLVFVAFLVARPLLLLAVLGLAVGLPEHGVVLGAFALAFALMWFGSLRTFERSERTGMLRPVAAAALLLTLSLPVAAETRAMALARHLNVDGDPAEVLRAFEAEIMRQASADLEQVTDWHRLLVEAMQDEDRPAQERSRAAAKARALLACRMLLEDADEYAIQAERVQLQADGLVPFSRLDEAITAYAAGSPAQLLRALELIQANLDGAELEAALATDTELSLLLKALIMDLRDAYGAAGPSSRELRRYLLQRATQGRTLLKPDPGPGVAYLLSVLLAAGLLSSSLLLGLAPQRATGR
jgi:hypothetical protein